jgi:hypothetical protein
LTTDSPAAAAPRLVYRGYWGFRLFCLICGVACAKLLGQRVHGHYEVFTLAGRALWTGGQAYATDFGTGVGYFFYSPFCALLVFGPLSWIPENIGLLAYMWVSWGLFVAGSAAFGRAASAAREPGVSGFPGTNFYWLGIAPQAFGAILASKLELAMTGMVLLALAWLIEGRRTYGAAVLLALALNWKFQPLPTVALAGIAWLLARRSWRVPAALTGFLALFYAIPFALVPWARLAEAHALWASSLAAFTRESYLNFENVFAFAANALHARASFAAMEAVSALAAAGLAAGALLWCRARTAEERVRGGLAWAAALGAMFTASFSPLAQNNALVLYAPLWLVGILTAESATGLPRRAWQAGLLAAWLAMTLPYSDVFPAGLRDELRHLSLKPVVCLLLGLAVARASFRPEWLRLRSGTAPA